jgi:antirestriction protein ArdC
MSVDRFDIHQHITDQILTMLDQPRADFQLPWHVPGSILRPRNAVTGKAYQGINILALWAAAECAGYASGIWATYRQWASLGAQVRKGEKSSYIVFYKQAGSGQDDGDDQTADGGATGPSPGTRLSPARPPSSPPSRSRDTNHLQQSRSILFTPSTTPRLSSEPPTP